MNQKGGLPAAPPSLRSLRFYDLDSKMLLVCSNILEPRPKPVSPHSPNPDLSIKSFPPVLKAFPTHVHLTTFTPLFLFSRHTPKPSLKNASNPSAPLSTYTRLVSLPDGLPLNPPGHSPNVPNSSNPSPALCLEGRTDFWPFSVPS